jgi:hypothetical protein
MAKKVITVFWCKNKKGATPDFVDELKKLKMLAINGTYRRSKHSRLQANEKRYEVLFRV